VTRESQIGQGLLTLSLSPDRENVNQALEQVHVFFVDTDGLPERAKEAFTFTLDQQLDLMAAAAERGCSLVVLSTDHSLEFYTTDRDRCVALRPVMQALANRVRLMSSLGRTRTLQLFGPAAARTLFNHAASLRSPIPLGRTSASSIHRAAAFSAANAALGPTLASLFRAAANVARRVRQETSLDVRNVGESIREVETFAAGRIVEEELAIWQAQEAEIQSATNDLPESANLVSPSFSSPEPVSEVRLRIGTSIKPRISYILEPKTASSSQ